MWWFSFYFQMICRFEIQLLCPAFNFFLSNVHLKVISLINTSQTGAKQDHITDLVTKKLIYWGLIEGPLNSGKFCSCQAVCTHWTFRAVVSVSGKALESWWPGMLPTTKSSWERPFGLWNNFVILAKYHFMKGFKNHFFPSKTIRRVWTTLM